jgi:tetratricopeptide (TPR) repeat protein
MASGYIQSVFNFYKGNEEAIRNINLILFSSRAFEKFRTYLEQSLRDAPNDGRLWLGLARLEENVGQPRKALKCVMRALEFNSNIAEAEERPTPLPLCG